MNSILNKLAACLALLSLLGAAPAQAQPFSRDYSFTLNENFNWPGSSRSIYGLIEHTDGKLLVYGRFNTPQYYSAVRFHSNGQVDQSFEVPYVVGESDINYVDEMPYGYYITHNGVSRTKVGHNGQLIEPDYRPTVSQQFAGMVYGKPLHLPGGKVLLGCTECRYPRVDYNRILGLVRLQPTGHFDSTFTPVVHPGAVGVVLAYGTDKVLMGGWPFVYNGEPVIGLLRTDHDGNIDSTFHSIFVEGYVVPSHVQPDGKILVTGNFKIQGFAQQFHLVRLTQHGILDHTFNNFNNAQVGAICPTSDGGYLFGGPFTQYQGHPVGRIVKTDANGFIEPGYFTGTGFDSAHNPNLGPSVINIVPGANDTYYAMGYFNGYNGEAVPQPIIRLNGPLTVSTPAELVQKPQLQVYPNPAHEQATINWQLPGLSHTAELVLTDIAGRELRRQAISGKQGQWALDTRSLQGGIYLLQIVQNGEQLAISKLSVIK